MMARDECETSSDELVKFLMRRNISLDVIKDSNFQSFLKNVAKNGQKSCMFLENSLVIEKSVRTFEQEIKQYMLMVIASWNTTGCSLMSYNIKGAQQNKCVVGFYCPKGFIFLEVAPSRQGIENALADLVPDPTSKIWKDIIQFVEHDACYQSECKYQALDLTGKGTEFLYGTDTRCVRQQIHEFWRTICKKSSWVQNLIKKSDEIFESIVTCNMNDVLFKNLKQKGVEEVAGWKHSSSFALLSMVMKVKSELGVWLSQLGTLQRFNLQYDTDVITSINSTDFWIDGENLVRVLTPFFEIPSLLDTLVPSAGYLGSAIDKASALLKTYSTREPYKYEPILACYKEWWESCFDSVQDLTCYLNPIYFFKQDLPEDFTLRDYPEFVDREDEGRLYAEIDAYCTKANPFADVSMSEFEANHPAILWSKYGGGFPLLQKFAYRFLSQPASCLCNQVEKHMSKLQESDNYLLRLNVMMMEEFTKLGDQVYQPIRL